MQKSSFWMEANQNRAEQSSRRRNQQPELIDKKIFNAIKIVTFIDRNRLVN